MKAIASGRVQGVYFRAFVAGHAERLGISGYARNQADGTVEVVAEGARADLDSLLSEVKRGPPRARVDRVEVTWSEPEGSFTGFRTA
ncbi:MAG: acylphosphatase [Chloroflexi bacterium]|nr:acylphosphatase [Chloroflexota bacterium]